MRIKYRGQDVQVYLIYDTEHQNIRIIVKGESKTVLILQKECDVFLEDSEEWMNLREALDKSLVKISSSGVDKFNIYEPREVTFDVSSRRIYDVSFNKLLNLLKETFVITVIDDQDNIEEFTHKNGEYHHNAEVYSKETFMEKLMANSYKIKRKYFKEEFFSVKESVIYRKLGHNGLSITMMERDENGRDVWGS